MSRAASPAFPSGLLDEPEPKVAPRSARWPEPLGFLVVTVVLALIIFFLMAGWLNRPSTASEWVLKGPVNHSMTLPPPATVARPPGPYQGFCDGSEVFCLSAESSQPADTLRQLAAALSVEPTQRYQIQLTITPLEQEATPVSEATRPSATPSTTTP